MENMQKYSDKELIQLLEENGNKNYAFSFIVHAYKERLYWHVRRMVIDHNDADDLVQETFIKAWEKLDQFQGKSQLFTWLYRIATNHCLEFLKRKKRRALLSFSGLESELTGKLEADPYFSGNEMERLFQRALLKLPEKQRIVFNMKYFDELKYSEISKILGTSEGALKASYHQAVKKIEKFVKEE